MAVDVIIVGVVRARGIVEGHYTDGDYDAFIKVVTESLKDVLNLINGVEGVANTKTIISLTNPIREF